MSGMSLEVEELCDTARWCYTRGWVPATSGNFSVRMAANLIFITGSGLDKGRLTPEGLLQIDLDGKVLSGDGKPSAETALHLVIYRDRPEVRAILHVHTIWNTLLSARRAGRGFVLLTNYELLKALSGVKTHEHKEQVPILENSQDYTSLSQALEKTLAEYPSAHGVLLSGHGFYTWGTSVTDARRHLEALEFLFEVEERRLSEGR
ncbi:MAG: methylthioribulose 1-phosphate dehydratase [Acidobacteriota bacterium]|nr:methylthioribulose 1-phosphate dehydratase [Acidobacteriota bacterium]